MRLEAELVPNTVWESSLHNLLPRKVWDKIRSEIIQQNGKKCQICGDTEGRMNLHEIWEYDDEKHIQKLKGFILLCQMCHHVKHIGFAGILASQGRLDYDSVIEHFCKVNQCARKDFESHEKKAFDLWRKRSQHQWKQDFGQYKESIKDENNV